MIITNEIPPSPTLTPFIRCYSYYEFDTRGADMIKPWHATYEISLVFFFKDLPVQLKSAETGQIVKQGTYCDIAGIGTQYNGEMTFNGRYAFFEIAFKPGGLYKIFNVSAGEFLNRIVGADDLFNAEIKILYEQLCGARNMKEMSSLANAFLLNRLKKQKPVYSKDIIVNTSNLILKNEGIVDIAQLARKANMSTRNLERYFIRQTGMSPKLFCCITRFNHALSLKLSAPRINWTSIAQSCGYFDQMHLVREFKRFSGNAPSAFFKETPLTEVRYTSRVE